MVLLEAHAENPRPGVTSRRGGGVFRWIPVAVVAGLLLVGCDTDKGTGVEDSTRAIDSLPVSSDARIQSDLPDAALGLDDELSVARVIYTEGGGFLHRSLIKLPPLPEGVDLAKLERAVLVLPYAGPDSSRLVYVTAHQIDADWSEEGVTWNTAPEFDSVVFDSARVSNHQIRFNVRSLYTAGDPELGVLLGTVDGSEQYFRASEAGDIPNIPFVEILHY